MHSYVEQILSQLQPTRYPGRGGYLRIKPSADPQHVCTYLIHERSAALVEVASRQMPPRLLNFSVPMQMLILLELMIARPTKPIDVRAIAMVQGGQAYVAERLEAAANELVMMAPALLEVVAQL